MDELTSIESALQALALAGNVEVHEDGEWLAELAGLRFEFRRQGNQALVHLWSEQRNLTRRVLRAVENSPAQLVLEVQRFGRPRSGRLSFIRADAPRPARRVSREQFRARFGRMLAEQFPDAQPASLSTAADLSHSLSGNYTRGLLVEGNSSWAVMGVSSEEEASTIEGILSFGLIWLDRSREQSQKRAVQGLRLFVPEGAARLPVERLHGLGTTARIEIYEFSPATWHARRMPASDSGNIESRLTPRREIEGALAAAREAIERIRGLSPENIVASVAPGTREVALRFRGLEFARYGDGRIVFGIGGERDELTSANRAKLENLVKQLDLHRSSLARDSNHPLYRAAAERWLETLVLSDPARLDAQLDPHFLYSQTPALSAGDRGVMDLLGVTRAGRLVIIELKASEDLHLPLQAVDYWLRVRAHHRDGDFPRYGYFSGVELDPRPPLVWLVAPGLRFHAAVEFVQRYLSPEIQLTRIGLNENWRRGIQVVFRT
ncbi:MAG: hypothetical protein ACRD4K_12480 [Candidatus Acidiferrales bacterium]